jgi:hypothetical protein
MTSLSIMEADGGSPLVSGGALNGIRTIALNFAPTIQGSHATNHAMNQERTSLVAKPAEIATITDPAARQCLTFRHVDAWLSIVWGVGVAVTMARRSTRSPN